MKEKHVFIILKMIFLSLSIYKYYTIHFPSPFHSFYRLAGSVNSEEMPVELLTSSASDDTVVCTPHHQASAHLGEDIVLLCCELSCCGCIRTLGRSRGINRSLFECKKQIANPLKSLNTV